MQSLHRLCTECSGLAQAMATKRSERMPRSGGPGLCIVPQGCCSDSCSRLLWSSPWRTCLALHVRRCERRQLLQRCDTNHRALSLNSCWSHVGRASRALQDMLREANVRGAGRAVCWLEQTYCPRVKGQGRCSGYLLFSCVYKNIYRYKSAMQATQTQTCCDIVLIDLCGSAARSDGIYSGPTFQVLPKRRHRQCLRSSSVHAFSHALCCSACKRAAGHPRGLTSAKCSYAVCMPSLAHACHQMISKAGVPETSSNSMARPCGGRQPNAPQNCCTQIAMWAKAARNRLHTPCWVSDSAHPASRKAHAQPSVAQGSNELCCPAF